MKRRHLLLMALSLILTICMCFAFAGCDSCSDDEAPAKLSTPVVTIDDNGVATWLEVENASGYAYVIDDKPEVSTTQLSVNLADGQSVKVKAKGDGANYSDSDFSELKTYNAPAKQPKKLASPEVTIAGDGTVTIGAVEHASKIVYVIGDGAETEYDASNKPVLTDGQTIKVTAKGDGTNYSDSDVVEKTHNATQPVDVMTHAEYTAAEKGADVCVKGIVTAFRGKNVFLADNDGGYYAFGVTEVPESLAVGVEIKVTGKKDIYNGLHEIAGGTVEITNATAVTVNPVDITAIIKNAENAGAADLIAKQNSYVTIAEAIISDVVEGTDSKGKATCTVTLTIGTKTIVYYVGGTSQLVDETQQGEIITAFKNALGKTADVTAIVAIRNNAIQLVPANATPLSDIKTTLEELDAPVVSVDQATGKATWNEVANATKYVYKIGENGTETDAPANREVQLVKGDTIYVKAIGDGTTYGDSDWSIVKVWSNVDPDTLPALDAPATVTISEDGLTISWPQVAGAAGYKYAVGDGADVETIELSVTLDTALTAGQTVKVKAVGDLINNKDSEYKTATYVAKLEAPVVEIDDNGVVTVTADTNAVKVVYVIADGAETDYNADSKPTLTNGQKITVTAKGNGTAYADSDPVEMMYVALMSHAEYAAAAKDASVCVKGVVTALKGKNIYFADSNGGYYAFNATNVPANLAVGMEIKVTGIKDIYVAKNAPAGTVGLDEITKAAVVITNETVATVTPVDITDTLKGATALSDKALTDLMNSYVVVTGATIDSNDTGTTINFTVGNLTVKFHVSGSTQVVTDEQLTTIKSAFAQNNGRTADIAGLITLYNGSVQLIPASEDPLSNIVLPQLSAPSVEIDEETGVATITNIDENGKAVYSIDGAEFADYDAENKPVVPYGKTIVVKAVNDGNYEESETASATYDAAQVQLAAPEISIIPVSGKVTIEIDPRATSCLYTVLDAEGNPVADKTDIPYDKNVELILEDGQSIKVVVSSSNGRYTSNEATEKYTQSHDLRAPKLEVDIDGNVSWGETGGANFTYKIKAKGADNFGDETTTADNQAQSVKINDGDTIYVKANKADDSQIDTNAHSTLTYVAPQKRTTPELAATDSIKANPANNSEVIITIKTVDDVKYKVSVDDAAYTDVVNGAVTLALKKYKSIRFIACGTTGDPVKEDGNVWNYHDYYKDSEVLDVVSDYNTFCTANTVAVWKQLTDIKNLNDGDEIILVYQKDGKVIANGVFESKYLKSVDISLVNNCAVINENVKPLTVKKDGDSFVLMHGTDYIGLNGVDFKLVSETDKVLWTITVSNTSATISTSSCAVKYNPSSPRFKPYASGQQDILIYINSLIVPTKLSAPQNVKFEKDVLSWNTVDNAICYNVYKGDTLVTETALTITSYTATEEGEYTVVAVGNGVDYINSDASISANLTYPAETDKEQLAAPTDVKFAEVSNLLTWNEVTGAIGYAIYKDAETDPVEMVDAGATLEYRATATGDYTVVALGDGKFTKDSTKSSVAHYEQPEQTQLATPQNLKVENNKLVWDPVTVDGVEIYYYVYKDGVEEDIAETNEYSPTESGSYSVSAATDNNLYSESTQSATVDFVKSAVPTNETISFTADERDSTVTDGMGWKTDNISVTCSASNTYNAPARFYANNTVTVTANQMTTIVFNCNNTTYATDLETSLKNLNNNNIAITKNEKVVTVIFTNAVNSFSVKMSKQVRVDSMVISLTPAV